MVADKIKNDCIVDDRLRYKNGDKGAIATNGCPILITERLVLRAPHDEDLDALTNLANNIHIAKMLTRLPHPYTAAHARAFIEDVRSGNIGNCIYAITQADTGIFMGSCAIHNPDEEGRVEIGYWLGEPYWGQGYATEVAHALVDLAFKVSDIECLYVSCKQDNAASRNVIKKVGFQHVSTYELARENHGLVIMDRFALMREEHMLNLSRKKYN